MVDAIAQNNNVFTRTDARVKMLASVVGLALVLGLPGIGMSFSVFVLVLASLIAVKIPLRLIVGRLLPPLLLGGVVFIFTLLFHQGQEQVWALELGGYHVAVYWESLQIGFGLLTKIIGCVSLVMFLSVTTPMHEIGYAMLWFRMPKVLVEILLLTYRYVFVIWEEAARMRDAQTLRLGYPSWRSFSGWRRAFKSTVSLMGMVFIRAYDRAESTFFAMQVRAYNGSTTGTKAYRWK